MTKAQHVWIYKFKIEGKTHDTRLYATKQLAIDKARIEVNSWEYVGATVDKENHSIVYRCRDGIKFELKRMEVRNSIIEE